MNSSEQRCPFCGTLVAHSPFGNVWCDQCDYRLETDRFEKRPLEDGYRAEIQRLRTMNEWISVKDRLPAEGHLVIAVIFYRDAYDIFAEDDPYHYALKLNGNDCLVTMNAYVREGVWSLEPDEPVSGTVLYWQPLPRPDIDLMWGLQ